MILTVRLTRHQCLAAKPKPDWRHRPNTDRNITFIILVFGSVVFRVISAVFSPHITASVCGTWGYEQDYCRPYLPYPSFLWRRGKATIARRKRRLKRINISHSYYQFTRLHMFRNYSLSDLQFPLYLRCHNTCTVMVRHKFHRNRKKNVYNNDQLFWMLRCHTHDWYSLQVIDHCSTWNKDGGGSLSGSNQQPSDWNWTKRAALSRWPCYQNRWLDVPSLHALPYCFCCESTSLLPPPYTTDEASIWPV